MGSIYRPGGSGGGGSIYRRGGSGGSSGQYHGPPPSQPTKKKGGSGGGGFFHTIGEATTNLAKGAERSVIGIPNALVTTGKALSHDTAKLAGSVAPARSYAGKAHSQPWETPVIARQVAKQYSYKYGPLFHGHPGKTAHRALVEDPFGTILDVATVASLGAGAAGKLLPAEATALRELPLRGPEALAKAGKLKPKGGAVPYIESTQPLTVGGRAVRGTAVRTRTVHAALNALPANTPVLGELSRFNRALNKLPRSVAAARRLQAIPLDRKLRGLNTSERQATALIARWPLPRLLDAQIAKWRQLGDDTGALQIATNPKVRALYDQPTPKIISTIEEARKLGNYDANLLAEQGALTPEAAAASPYLHMRATSGAKLEDGAWVGGEPIQKLQAELAASGRPQPTYLHDTAIDRGTGGPTFEPTGGGKSPTPRSPVRQNEAVLASLGQLLLDPSTLVSQHIRAVKFGLYKDVHATLESASMKVPQGTRLPEGWEYLRRPVHPGARTGEKIGYAEQTAGEYQRQLEQAMPDLEKGGPEQFATTNENEAATVGKDRLIIPSSTVRDLTGEFARSSKTTRLILEKPLDVWRALLLNWSPRWLMNNIVGNSFMGLLRFGGPRYVREWIRAVGEHSGPAAIDKLLKDEATTSHLTETDIAEIFGEQVAGTFKGQNVPLEGKVSRAVEKSLGPRAGRLIHEGLTPIDRGYEQALRRTAIRTQVKASPEARALYKQMPRQARSWRAASKEALKNPALVKKISQEVNSGLGDFTSMSQFEKNWLRRLVPFYGWYRAITGVVLRLPIEAPLRTRLLAQLANIQQEDQDMLNPGLRSYLRGSVPLPGGGILRTQGINPYATVPQLGRGATFGAVGGSQEASQTFLGMLNPFLQGLVSSIPGRSEQSQGFLRNEWKGVYGGLPPLQAADLLRHGAPPSKLYYPSELDQLLSLVGVPIRHPRQPLKR